eukprot:jgi/Botrbrau1/16429/Bobra.0142s0028.1
MESLRSVPLCQREEHISSLTRVELQKAAKEAGLKANVKSSILVASLLEKLASEEGPFKEDPRKVTLTADESVPEDSGGVETGSLQENDSVVQPKGNVPEGPAPPSPTAVDMETKDSDPLPVPSSQEIAPTVQPGMDAGGQSDGCPVGVQEQSAPVVDKVPEMGVDCQQLSLEVDVLVAGGPQSENMPPVVVCGTPDFEECFSQTLQNAVAYLDPTKSTSLADCLDPMGSLQDQRIDLISISPLIKEHCVSARPSPWMHGPPPVAPSVDLDAVIAAADTAFADCCEDTDFVEMALQDPPPTPGVSKPETMSDQMLVDVEKVAVASMPAVVPSAQCPTKGNSAVLELNPAPGNAAPSLAAAAENVANGAGLNAGDPASVEATALAVPTLPASRTIMSVPMISPFEALSHGRDDQSGATVQILSKVQSEVPSREGLEHPGPSDLAPRSIDGAENCSAVNSPVQGVSDLRSYSRGRESGIWEGRNMTELHHLQQDWDTLKQSNSGRSWSIPSIAEVQAKSHQLAASGFTTVGSPKMRPQSRLLVAQSRNEDRKRPREALIEDKESVPKRPTLAGQNMSRLAKPGRDPLKAIDKSNITVPGQTHKEQGPLASMQKAVVRQGNIHTLPGPRTFGLPVPGTQTDRRKPSYQTVKGRTGIPTFKSGK